MADYIVKRQKPFTVKIEGVKGEFAIPAPSALDIETINIFTGVDEADMLTRANMAKAFLIAACPDLEGQASDFDMNMIFNAYLDHFNDEAGES